MNDLGNPYWYFIVYNYIVGVHQLIDYIVQELCESRGGRPGLSVLTSLAV